MVTPVNIKGSAYFAIVNPSINSRSDVKAFRDALLDVVDTCLISEETKEVTSCNSLRILLSMIVELNKDLED